MFLFAFAFSLLSIHLLSPRYFSRSPSRAPLPVPAACVQQRCVAAAATTLHVSPLFYRFVDILHHLFLSTFQSCLLCFSFASSSVGFLLTSSSNHQTTARIIVLCVKCFCFCLWLPTTTSVAATRRFRWLLWRRSKNVPSCRLDSGHFDRPTEMIQTV